MDIIEQIIDDLDLKQTRIVGQQLVACCPAHTDNAPSFQINLSNFRFNCFGCDLSGEGLNSLYSKLKRVNSFNFDSPEIKKLIKESKKQLKKKINLEVRDSWIPILTQNQEMAIKKMAMRDVSEEVVRRFRIGYNVKKDILFFPVFDHSGSLTAWVERSSNYKCRYLTMPGGVQKSFLYGEEFIREGAENNIYITDGIVDCLKLWTWGFKAVCAMGSALTAAQGKRLVDLAKHVYIVPDNDSAGEKFVQNIIKHLAGRVPHTVITLPKNLKDVGEKECTFDIFKESIIRALNEITQLKLFQG
jgi:DNA primase